MKPGPRGAQGDGAHLVLAGLTLLIGVDRFMSQMRATTNLVGKGVATIVIAKWENEFDQDPAHRILNGEPAELPLVNVL